MHVTTYHAGLCYCDMAAVSCRPVKDHTWDGWWRAALAITQLRCFQDTIMSAFTGCSCDYPN